MTAHLTATLSIMFNALAAMVKIFLVSAVGIFIAKFPRGDPLLPAVMIRYLSKLTNNVFVPALIITSLGSAITFSLLNRIGILIIFCFVTNTISYCFGYSIGRLLHGRSDDPMFTALIVAIGSPNAISLPIMVMQTMCDESYVKKDYDNSQSKCFAEATSMLFVYSMGWHLMFWSYGFVKLKNIRKRFYAELSDISADLLTINNYVTPSSEQTMTEYLIVKIAYEKNKAKLIDWLRTIFLTPAMIAIFVGVSIGLLPYAQAMMFRDMSFLRPLGSAITTLGEPVVAVNCLVMSASLAQVDFSAGKKNKDGDNNIIITNNESTNSASTDSKSNIVDKPSTPKKSVSKYLISSLPSLNSSGKNSSQYSRLDDEEDIDSSTSPYNTESKYSDSSNQICLDVNDGTVDDAQNAINDENESSIDDNLVTRNYSESKSIGNSSLSLLRDNNQDQKEKSTMIELKVQGPAVLKKKDVEIPPPTYRSIFALIICR